MKNPAKPGDFGTNGTRGVVGSGMSETTNSADFPIGVSVSVTQTCGKPASEFEMLTYAWYALGAKMRAAEGGVGDFTPTRSANVVTASEAQTSKKVPIGDLRRQTSVRRLKSDNLTLIHATEAALLYQPSNSLPCGSWIV